MSWLGERLFEQRQVRVALDVLREDAGHGRCRVGDQLPACGAEVVEAPIEAGQLLGLTLLAPPPLRDVHRLDVVRPPCHPGGS